MLLLVPEAPRESGVQGQGRGGRGARWGHGRGAHGGSRRGEGARLAGKTSARGGSAPGAQPRRRGLQGDYRPRPGREDAGACGRGEAVAVTR